MAKIQRVDLLCDECGKAGKETTEGVESYPFGRGDRSYVVDLCAKHAEKFVRALDAMVAIATPVVEPRPLNGRRGAGSPVRVHRTQAPVSRQALMAWADGKGVVVKARGRVPEAIMEQYRAWEASGAR